jgi:osmoprotectant transport system ATP-binding protein
VANPSAAFNSRDNRGAHTNPGSALAARDVVHRYGGVAALNGVTVRVAPGGALALVGESGSGKTTLLRCFNRMVEPAAGTIEVSGTDVRQQSPIELRRHIGYVPQDGGLLPHWRVLRNVALVPTLLKQPGSMTSAERALDLVGLPASRYGGRFPHELSGGQRQRVALARAIAAKPVVILLDEPFGALDAITRGDLQSVFADIRRELGMTTVLVTHDLAEAARLADEIAVLHQGRIEQQGRAAILRDNPATEYIAALFARALAAPDALRPA